MVFTIIIMLSMDNVIKNRLEISSDFFMALIALFFNR